MSTLQKLVFNDFLDTDPQSPIISVGKLTPHQVIIKHQPIAGEADYKVYVKFDLAANYEAVPIITSNTAGAITKTYTFPIGVKYTYIQFKIISANSFTPSEPELVFLYYLSDIEAQAQQANKPAVAFEITGKLNPIYIPTGLNPRGPYDEATNYAVGDSVDYLGSSYLMYVDAAAGTIPTDTDYWQVLAAKGELGETGDPGPPGPAGADGDMTGPESSTDNAIARFDAATGKVLQNSGVTINDNNEVKGTAASFQHSPDYSKTLKNYTPISFFDEGLWVSGDVGVKWVKGASGTAADDTTNVVKSDQAITVETSADGSYVVQLTKTGTFDFSNVDNFLITFKIDESTDPFVVWQKLKNINISFVDADNSDNYDIDLKNHTLPTAANNTAIIKSGWITLQIPRALFIAHGSAPIDPDWSTIGYIKITTYSDDANQVTVTFNELATFDNNSNKGILLVTFDDAYETSLAARSVLDQYGFAATMFINGSTVGTGTIATLAQIKSLQDNNGWTIGSHAYTHTDLTGQSAADLEANIQNNINYMSRNGLKGSRYFAYPNGLYNAAVKALVEKYHPFARTVDRAGAGYNSTPILSPLDIKTLYVTYQTAVATLEDRIDEIEAGKGTEVLLFHKITAPGDDSTDLEYDLDKFTSVIDYAATKDIEVLTFAQYEERLRQNAQYCSITEVNTSTESQKSVSPDALAGSVYGVVKVQTPVVEYTTECATGDGKWYFDVPADLNGWNLISARVRVITAGVTNATTFDLYNVTDATTMLTANMSIASAGTTASASIDTAHDDVATGDLLRLDCDAISTTAPKGLIVTLRFQHP